MPDYAYVARDATGQKVSGTLAAATEREVINILSGRSLFPVQVSTGKAAAAPGAHLKVRAQAMATVYTKDQLKVGERTARTYVARDDFPAPDAKVSNRRFWKRATVERWQKATLPLKFDPRSKQ